jgi:hypothetical protein
MLFENINIMDPERQLPHSIYHLSHECMFVCICGKGKRARKDEGRVVLTKNKSKIIVAVLLILRRPHTAWPKVPENPPQRRRGCSLVFGRARVPAGGDAVH